MNHIYRLIWNQAMHAWVVASEIARSSGKRSSGVVLAAILVSAPALALDNNALPSGGAVSSGQASIGQSGSTLTVNQQSQNVAINWQDFNIGSNAAVNFAQPNSSAIALNRVLGANGTQILGQLNANGQVWVLNPNGVLFGRGAQVNVGGLVASTLGISDADFMAGKRTFTGQGGSVINQGTINADYVALLGEQVRNEGAIVARLGTVAMGAGSQVTLDFAGDKLLSMQVDQGAVRALAENKGLIEADGGTVLMTAKARDALIDTVVNNTGVIRARTLENHAGRILLIGDMDSGTVNVDGTLDASAANGGNGGFIETSAAHVKVADTANVTTKAAGGKNGTWLIDPVDFTIAASGGDMTGTALSNALTGGNVTIQSTSGATGTAGDINVKDTVSWNANTLTLNAQNNINILAQMNGSGTAGLALEYGQANLAANNTSTYNINAPVNLTSTGSFSTKLGSDGAVTNYTIITSLGAEGSTTGTDLQGMNGDRWHNYVLGADIDARATAGWDGGAGFTAIGGNDIDVTSGNFFKGNFDGLGHVIDGLTINRPGTINLGLFGRAENASFANVGLANASITGRYRIGGLVGTAQDVTVRNSYVSGAIKGLGQVGGLVGYDPVVRGSVRLSHVYSTANVTATTPGGGTAARSGEAGGLIGWGGYSIDYSYATGIVTGGNFVGGLATHMAFSPSQITNSYFTGSVRVNGTPYAVGAILAEAVGYGNIALSLTNVYWNTDTVGAGVGAVGRDEGSLQTNVSGLTTAQMRDASNWVGFDFTTTPGGNGWVLIDSHSTVLPMLASEWSPVIHNAHQLQLMALDKSANYTLAGNIDASATHGASGDVWLDSSFATVGTGVALFTGSFDGQGHTIRNLHIDAGLSSRVGLFGETDTTSVIRNVGLVDVSVSGTEYVGGLVGLNNGTVSNAYVTGSVTGSMADGDVAGGLVGYNRGSISNAYSAASVTGNNAVGGLVGYSAGAGASVSNSYATGSATGNSNVGGLIGDLQSGSVSNSYYATTDVANAVINNGGATGGTFTGNGTGSGKTYADLTKAETFAAWDMDTAGGNANVWRIYEGNATPLLKAFLTRLDGTVNNDSTTYNGQAQTGNAGYVVGAHDGSLLLGTGSVTGGGVNAGSHALQLSGLYSTQQGYDIVVANGLLTIGKANATVTANSDTVAHNGVAQSVSGYAVTGLVNNEISSVLTGLTESGGSGTDIGRYAHTVSGTDGNYALTFVDGALTINPAGSGDGNGGSGAVLGTPALARYVAANVAALAGEDKLKIDSDATAVLQVDRSDRSDCQMKLPAYLMNNCK